MLDPVEQRGVEGQVRHAFLALALLALVCAAGFTVWTSTMVHAQEPQVWLVRGDGHQILEGLDLVSVSAGDGQSCGDYRDGAAACRGGSQHGQAEAPSGYFSQVSAGEHHGQTANEDGNW